jgi:2-polyprenyl-6-methoxyphenol hydroxylase-like FAD-dependent oxidoreductase
MRGIQNLYREPGGPGWALVGDAFHQKDPLDAQGIYDALAGARLLSLALAAWWQGTATWEAALAWYDAAVRADSYVYFQSTTARVQREFYSGIPHFIWRWLSRGQEPMRRFAALLTRTIDPARWCPPDVVAEALVTGMAEELFLTVTGRGGEPAPAAAPEAQELTWYDDVARNTARAVIQALQSARGNS